jgi:hypothetical protein
VSRSCLQHQAASHEPNAPVEMRDSATEAHMGIHCKQLIYPILHGANLSLLNLIKLYDFIPFQRPNIARAWSKRFPGGE